MGRAQRLTCGGLCFLTGFAALLLTIYCAILAALLGVAANGAPSFNNSVTECQHFSQEMGGECNWHCSATQGAGGESTCTWCDSTSSPSLCVGAMGNSSWAPLPVGAPAVCAARSTCSSCQYGDPSSPIPLLACAAGASLIVAASLAAVCQNCVALCGCLEGLGCCCCSCFAVLGCSGTIGACGLARRALCSDEGCNCCGCQCMEPADGSGTGGSGGGGGVGALGASSTAGYAKEQYISSSALPVFTGQAANAGYAKLSSDPGSADANEPLLLVEGQAEKS